MLDNRRTLLVVAFTGGWLVWFITNVTVWAMSSQDDIRQILLWTAVETLAGAAVCLLLLLVSSRIQRHIVTLWRSILACLALCVVAAVLWNLATGHSVALLERIAYGWVWTYRLSFRDFLRSGLARTTALGSFCLLYAAINHRFELEEQRRRARDATVLAHQTQLQMLRYQLNPHFLFNALNSIRALILEDGDRARLMLTELAEFLRYSLVKDEQESTIEDEIRAIASYLALQHLRFEERLVVSIHVDPEARTVTVPCFLVHPLVENAVKYGMRTSPMPLRIAIEVVRRGPLVLIRVVNTGHLGASPDAGHLPGEHEDRESTGTGLVNVRRRLQLAFAGRHSFELLESEGRVSAEIHLQHAGG